MMEKDVVIKYVQKLLNEFGNTRRMNPPVRGTDIGIISPYIKQVGNAFILNYSHIS